MSEPSVTAVKTLFAHSRNLCFYERCERKLTDPKWKRVNARIAHIKGENPGSARYDPEQSDTDRQGYENLMLLCPQHHTDIDDLLPHEHPVERLVEMRAKHLEHRADREWSDDQALAAFTVHAFVVSGYHPPEFSASGAPSDQAVSLGPLQVNVTVPAPTVSGGSGRGATDRLELTDSVQVDLVRRDEPRVVQATARGELGVLGEAIGEAGAPDGIRISDGGGAASSPDIPAKDGGGADPTMSGGAASLLTEDGDRVLTEDGGRIVLDGEPATPADEPVLVSGQPAIVGGQSVRLGGINDDPSPSPNEPESGAAPSS